ncbi:YlzJ-like family protein [Alicyclobacillus kakegawensis]|uniref:YlzJ-like family protein n=1 Tax=Alicyclobacillus kakegawensis TaxID=392012 RepID=UPI000830DA36|nr:YlzJ-like family protein [Alicyclobacillus kakegawensis]
MSLFWSIVPFGAVMSELDEVSPYSECDFQGVHLLVTPTGTGKARIERVLSPCPQDYLRPDLRPGTEIPYHGG